MESAPAEILHQICSLLSFKDVANTRLVCRTLAGIGQHHLVTRVRFHHSEKSLQRLKEMAAHPVYSQAITELCFEAQLLRSVCRNAWMDHCSYTAGKPTMPAKSRGLRAMRAYHRALVKWEAEIEERYQAYGQVIESQSTALQTMGSTLATVMPSFRRLVTFEYKSNHSCSHYSPWSQRFEEGVKTYQAFRGRDTAHTAQELEYVLCPGGQPLKGLQTLCVNDLNPKVFASTMRLSIGEAFVTMKKITLTLRLPENDPDLGLPGYYHLRDGCVAQALGRAVGLRELTIKFFDNTYDGPCTSIDNVLGDHSWPELKKLHLGFMSSEPDPFIKTLKRHPKLKDLGLESMTLDEGCWPAVIAELRQQFQFDRVLFRGTLEDEIQIWDTDVIDVEMYRFDDAYVSLADHLDMYLTTPSEDGCDINPLFFYDDFRRPEEISMTPSFDDDSEMADSDGDEDDEDMSLEADDDAEADANA